MAGTMTTPKGEAETPSVLELLLRPEAPNVQAALPTAKYRIKRLSEALHADVVFTLRALPYGQVQQIKTSPGDDQTVQIVLAGVVEPNLKDPALKEKFGGATPEDTLNAILLPGEIEELDRAIEKLSGYRQDTIDEVKNASGTTATQT